MTLTLPIKTVSEANTRTHWAVRAKRAKLQRRAAAFALRGPATAFSVSLGVATALFGKSSPAVIVVALTRIAPRALDDDNLRGALKAVRDGVADAIGVDDRDPRVRYAYEQRRGPAKVYAVDVTIEAA